MPSDWERGYSAGYRAAHDTDVRDITIERGQDAPRKKTRKTTQNDRKMSKALQEANRKAKKTNGDFRKGWDQSRLMKEAHRLKRKM